jgi:nitrite reductase (NADH) small subunit
MTPTWVRICGYDDLLPERPVAALVDTRQVAVVRLADGSVHAVDNRDPFSRAHVLSRGIVGNRGDTPMLVSPMHKHAFDLRTGRCLDDATARLCVHHVRLVDDAVEIALAADVEPA